MEVRRSLDAVDGTLTSYGAELFSDIVFGNASPPSTVWFALCTGEPSVDDNGSQIPEMVASFNERILGSAFENSLPTPYNTGYARVSYPWGGASWVKAGRGRYRNASFIDFPDATNNWPPVVGWAICTSSSGGETIAIGACDVNIGDTQHVRIPSNGLVIKLVGVK